MKKKHDSFHKGYHNTDMKNNSFTLLEISSII